MFDMQIQTFTNEDPRVDGVKALADEIFIKDAMGEMWKNKKYSPELCMWSMTLSNADLFW